MKRLLAAVSVLVAAFLFTACPRLEAGDAWPSFQNGGTVSLSPSSPVELGELEWQIDLKGYGQSAPIILNDQVYVSTVDGDQKDVCLVTAYRLADGRQLWQHSMKNASPTKSSSYVSRAAPSPVADESGLICFFEGGNMVALTAAGKVRWERNLVEDYGSVDARHGLSSSPEQDKDFVYVWVERSDDPYVICLDKQTGKTKWKAAGLGATSWASPRLVPVAGGHHLVLSAIGSIVGFDPATGERLWTFTDISGNSTPSPMPLGQGRFLIGATTGRGESGGGRAADSNGVVEVVKSANEEWTAQYVWQAKRATSSFGSPIVHDGIAFFVNREGVLYGLDVTDGKEIFAKRLKGSVWATPIGIGNKTFFFGKDGVVQTLTDARSGQKLATWNNLPQPMAAASDDPEAPSDGGAVLYAASYVDGKFLLRRGDVLYAVNGEVK
ncbi:MAG: PQQ-binding-like beta-propeller repeat protein [Fuerstiella sp.]